MEHLIIESKKQHLTELISMNPLNTHSLPYLDNLSLSDLTSMYYELNVDLRFHLLAYIAMQVEQRGCKPIKGLETFCYTTLCEICKCLEGSRKTTTGARYDYRKNGPT